MAKKKFSMWDDPSFSNYTKKDWEEWEKNNKGRGVPPAICVGCLNQLVDGSCEVYTANEQMAIIGLKKCEERFD